MLNLSLEGSFQFSSVAQSYPTLCDPMNRSMPGLPVHHQFPEFTQIHIRNVNICGLRSQSITERHRISSRGSSTDLQVNSKRKRLRFFPTNFLPNAQNPVPLFLINLDRVFFRERAECYDEDSIVQLNECEIWRQIWILILILLLNGFVS